MKINKSITKFAVVALCLLCLAFTADAQKRRTRSKTRAKAISRTDNPRRCRVLKSEAARKKFRRR